MEQVLDLAWLVPLLPLLAAALIAAFGKLLPGGGSEIGIAAGSVAFVVSALIGWQTFFESPSPTLEQAVQWAPLGNGFVVELGMLVDGLTAMMFVLVTFVSLMVQIYSREYMRGEQRFTYFFAMLSLFTFSMLFLVIANNTLQAIVGWELVGVCSYLLIGFYWEEKSNQDAGNKAFLTTKFADVGLIVGVIVLSSAMFDVTDNPFNIPATIEAAIAGEIASSTIILGCLMIFLGAVGKSGQMPLHVWLPDAMAGPTPVSALIHAATMVTAGVFLIARLYPVFAQSLVVLNTIAIVGVITLFFAGFLAFVVDDIKKVLAYSTISQLGYMVAALGVGGYTASIFHLFTHGFFKALLFLGSGSLIHAVHSNNMSDMGGMRKHMPITFWTFIIGSLALAGFPLTAGFFSKDEVLVSGELWAENGFITGDLVFYVGLAGAFVTTFYMARAVFLIFWGDNRSHHPPHESGVEMTAPLTALAVAALFIGLIGSPLVPAETNFEQWTATVALEETRFPFVAEEVTEGGFGDDALESEDHALGAIGAGQARASEAALAEGKDPGGVLHGAPKFDLFLITVTSLLFLGAVSLAWRIYGRGMPERDPLFHMGFVSKALINKYWFDSIGYRYVVVPVRDRLSPWAYWTNQNVLDAAVKGAGGTVRRLAFSTYRTLDQKVIDGGVNGAAFSAAWWSERLKRIQSGDVQRYAGALVSGVIVLILVFAAAG